MAALVVLVSHCLITVPVLDRPFGAVHDFTSPLWWVAFTPLHTFWDGTSAVYVFFVLSGFVLAAPLVDGWGTLRSWVGYYPRRVCRLYLPALASLLFALATVAVMARRPSAQASHWVNQHATTPHGLGAAAHDSLLVLGSTSLNSPLWSMRWEVIFSLLLPLFVIAAAATRGVPAWVRLAGLLLLVSVGDNGGSGPLQYLPMFAVGVVLSYERKRLADLGSRLRSWQGCLMVVAALLLLSSGWSLYVLTSAMPMLTVSALLAPSLVVGGAALLVFLMGYWQPARSAGDSGPGQWLGKRSFSLYLVHEPVLLVVVYALGAHPNLVITLGIAMPAALLVADLFQRAVEGPSLHLSRRIGRWARARPLWKEGGGTPAYP